MAQTATERMEVVVKALDDYEKKSGLPEPTNPGTEEELQGYFCMTRDEIEALSPGDCVNIAYRLGQYALYLQRLYNRETARHNWAKTTMQEVIAKDLEGHSKWTKHETKVALICAENEFVHKVNEIVKYSQQRIDRLFFLSNNVKYLAEVMISNQRAKMAENRT